MTWSRVTAARGALWIAAIAAILGILGGCVPPSGVRDSAVEPSYPPAYDDAPNGDDAFVIPVGGVHGVGPYFGVWLPDSRDLEDGLGFGVEISGADLGLAARLAGGIWTVRSHARRDSAGMLEVSWGLGPFVYGGVGAAVPIWESGEIDLEPTLLGFAGLMVVFGRPACLGGPSASITTRHAWYSKDAYIDGEGVDLDGWQITATIHVRF